MINRLAKEFNCLVELKCMCTFELMFGYSWWAICHAVYKDNSREQVRLCCILFEFSLMHAHRGTSGTCVLTQNILTSIF